MKKRIEDFLKDGQRRSNRSGGAGTSREAENRAGNEGARRNARNLYGPLMAALGTQFARHTVIVLIIEHGGKLILKKLLKDKDQQAIQAISGDANAEVGNTSADNNNNTTVSPSISPNNHIMNSPQLTLAPTLNTNINLGTAIEQNNETGRTLAAWEEIFGDLLTNRPVEGFPFLRGLLINQILSGISIDQIRSNRLRKFLESREYVSPNTITYPRSNQMDGVIEQALAISYLNSLGSSLPPNIRAIITLFVKSICMNQDNFEDVIKYLQSGNHGFPEAVQNLLNDAQILGINSQEEMDAHVNNYNIPIFGISQGRIASHLFDCSSIIEEEEDDAANANGASTSQAAIANGASTSHGGNANGASTSHGGNANGASTSHGGNANGGIGEGISNDGTGITFSINNSNEGEEVWPNPQQSITGLQSIEELLGSTSSLTSILESAISFSSETLNNEEYMLTISTFQELYNYIFLDNSVINQPSTNLNSSNLFGNTESLDTEELLSNNLQLIINTLLLDTAYDVFQFWYQLLISFYITEEVLDEVKVLNIHQSVISSAFRLTLTTINLEISDDETNTSIPYPYYSIWAALNGNSIFSNYSGTSSEEAWFFIVMNLFALYLKNIKYNNDIKKIFSMDSGCKLNTFRKDDENPDPGTGPNSSKKINLDKTSTKKGNNINKISATTTTNSVTTNSGGGETNKSVSLNLIGFEKIFGFYNSGSSKTNCYCINNNYPIEVLNYTVKTPSEVVFIKAIKPNPIVNKKLEIINIFDKPDNNFTIKADWSGNKKSVVNKTTQSIDPYPGPGDPYPGPGDPYPGPGDPYPGPGDPYPDGALIHRNLNFNEPFLNTKLMVDKSHLKLSRSYSKGLSKNKMFIKKTVYNENSPIFIINGHSLIEELIYLQVLETKYATLFSAYLPLKLLLNTSNFLMSYLIFNTTYSLIKKSLLSFSNNKIKKYFNILENGIFLSICLSTGLDYFVVLKVYFIYLTNYTFSNNQLPKVNIYINKDKSFILLDDINLSTFL